MLRELRHEKGVTQEALAEFLGKPQSYVSKYELGERRIDVVEAIEVCRALNADFVAFVQQLTNRIESKRGGNIASPRNSRYSRHSDKT
jgi:transcriptional regulator with XRE-family HTH domain